jgi:hypothetical protein
MAFAQPFPRQSLRQFPQRTQHWWPPVQYIPQQPQAPLVCNSILFANSLVTITSQPVEPTSNRQSIIAGVAGGIGGLALGCLAAALVVVFYRRPQRQQTGNSGLRISEPIISRVRTSLPPPPPPRPLQRRSGPSGPSDSASAAVLGPRNGDVQGSPGGESTSTATFLTDDRTPSERQVTSASPQLFGRWTGRTRYSQVANPSSLGEGYTGPRRIATLDFRSVKG